MKQKLLSKWLQVKYFVFNLAMLMAFPAFPSSGLTLGSMASGITKSFTDVTYMITGGSYVAGLGFAVGAILKFKQHKENPTQVELGKPVTYLLVAASLLFLPSILNVAGTTLFGSGATTSSPTGTKYSAP